MLSLLVIYLALATVGRVLAQVPAEVIDLITIDKPNGSIRYKEPGLCDTVEGVRLYSGYLDIAENKHLFFWFFESKHAPFVDPTTIWLNGGPGSDSLYGLFDDQSYNCKLSSADSDRTRTTFH